VAGVAASSDNAGQTLRHPPSRGFGVAGSEAATAGPTYGECKTCSYTKAWSVISK
jgi:hypothetical protein